MPRATTKIAYMVDSASEDEFQKDDIMLTPDSAIENQAPGRRGKPDAKKPTAPAAKGVKAKAAPRRVSGASVLGARKENAGVGKKVGAKRKVLADRPEMSDTEEVDQFEDDEAEVEVEMEVEKPAPKKRGRPRTSNANDSLVEVAPPKGAKRGPKAVAASKAAPKAAGKTAKGAKRVVKQEPDLEIPETQLEPDMMDMDVDETIEKSIEYDEVPEMPPPRKPVAKQTTQPRPSSMQRQTSAPRRRAGSASDTERGGNDPALRRKLGDMKNQFENISLKYQNLKEVGIQDRDTIFDQLKRTTDQREKDQDAVIKSLKQQVSALQSRSSETASLRKEIAALAAANGKLSSDNKSLSASLATAQNENKTISAKLAQARSSAPPESKTMQGSAVKQRSVVLPGSAEAQREAQIRQLKEDLYSDLTGLIIRGIKKGEDGDDIYDCLQTGRNGTLHFRFSVSTDDAETSYDDVQFGYEPILDEGRDSDLFDILPDYATDPDGIVFPRSHAAKFYGKIVECMTKRIVTAE